MRARLAALRGYLARCSEICQVIVQNATRIKGADALKRIRSGWRT